MNNKSVESPTNTQWNIRYYDISNLQHRYANPGLLEIDLVSDKMNEAVIYNIAVVKLRWYIIHV